VPAIALRFLSSGTAGHWMLNTVGLSLPCSRASASSCNWCCCDEHSPNVEFSVEMFVNNMITCDGQTGIVSVHIPLISEDKAISYVSHCNLITDWCGNCFFFFFCGSALD
jgi:hypothetical protein